MCRARGLSLKMFCKRRISVEIGKSVLEYKKFSLKIASTALFHTCWQMFLYWWQPFLCGVATLQLHAEFQVELHDGLVDLLPCPMFLALYHVTQGIQSSLPLPHLDEFCNENKYVNTDIISDIPYHALYYFVHPIFNSSLVSQPSFVNKALRVRLEPPI